MKELPAYARFTLIGIGLALIILGMVAGRNLLLPLAWALLFALLILPVQVRLEKLLHRRAISAVLSVLLLGLISGSILYLLSSQVMHLVDDLPRLSEKISQNLEDFRQFLDQKIGIPYHEQPTQFADRMGTFLQERIHSIGTALTNTVKTLVYIGLLPIYIFLMLFYRHRLTQFIFMLYPAGEREAVVATVSKASTVVQKYLSGMVIVTGIVAILVLVVFLALGIRHALLFAVFLAIFNLIPYVGVFIASFISIAYVFVTKDSLFYPIITLILLWGIQLLENNLITPFIVGRQVQLNPLAIIIAIILGGLIWGVSGMILFIPLLGGLKTIMDEIPSLRPYGFLLGDDPPYHNAKTNP